LGSFTLLSSPWRRLVRSVFRPPTIMCLCRGLSPSLLPLRDQCSLTLYASQLEPTKQRAREKMRERIAKARERGEDPEDA
jgi:hypothetical protein